MVRVGPAAVHVLEAVRTIVERDRVVAQVDSVHLNEGGHHLSLRVRDRARGRKRPLVRDSARQRSRQVAAVVERLRRVRRSHDVREGHVDRITWILMRTYDGADPFEDVGPIDRQEDQRQDDQDRRDPLAAIGRASRRRRPLVVLVLLITECPTARSGFRPEGVLLPTRFWLRSHRTGRPTQLRLASNSLSVPRVVALASRLLPKQGDMTV